MPPISPPPGAPPVPPAIPSPPLPPAPPHPPPAGLAALLAELDAANAANATRAASAYALSTGSDLNRRAATEATDALGRLATRMRSLQLLERVVTIHGEDAMRTSEGAVQLARAVGALVQEPLETTSDALAIGGRLMDASLASLYRRDLPLTLRQARQVAAALHAAIATSASRLHPSSAMSARLRRVRRRRLVDGSEAASGEAGEAASGDDDDDAVIFAPSAELADGSWLVQAGYAAFAPVAAQLLESARTFVVQSLRPGAPTHFYNDRSSSILLPMRQLSSSPNGLGMHALWNVSCDPLFRDATSGASGDVLRLVVPSDTPTLHNIQEVGGGTLTFRVADVCDFGEEGGGSAMPIEGPIQLVGSTEASMARRAQPSPSASVAPAPQQPQRAPPMTDEDVWPRRALQPLPDPRWATTDVGLLSFDTDPFGAASEDWRIETRVLSFTARRRDSPFNASIAPRLYGATFSLPLKPFDDGRRTDHLVADAGGQFAPEALYAAATGRV